MAWTIPRTWVAGEIVTAANVNTHLRDNLLAISGAWTAYTTTWSGTVGTGTKAASYTRIGRSIHWRITILWGSTTSHAASNQTLTLPVTEAGYNLGSPMGDVGFWKSGTGINGAGWAQLSAGQTVVLQPKSFGDGVFVSNIVPWTWGNGDILTVSGTYEASTD